MAPARSIARWNGASLSSERLELLREVVPAAARGGGRKSIGAIFWAVGWSGAARAENAPVDGPAVASDNAQFRVTVESTRVSLTVRKTGASLAYQQWADYTVYDHGRAIGRIYEDRATRPALRWFWSITMIGARHKGIRTDGCTPTLKQAKAELQANWRKWLVSARLEEPTVSNDHH